MEYVEGNPRGEISESFNKQRTSGSNFLDMSLINGGHSFQHDGLVYPSGGISNESPSFQLPKIYSPRIDQSDD
jgi:hypothetical protein